jgi:hypothetical protein
MGLLPAFVSSKHHIGLGAPGFEAGFMLNSIVKRAQDSPYGKVHQGGPNDQLGTGRSSSWTMDNFSGGNYQPEFSDPAMFAQSRNMMPTQQSRSARSTPGLVQAKPVSTMGNAGASLAVPIPAGTRPIATMHAGGQAIFGFQNRIVRATVTGAAVVTTNTDSHATQKTCFFMEPISGTIYAGGTDGKIYTFNVSTLALTATINPIDIATGAAPAGTPSMIHVWGDMLFVAWGVYLYVQLATGQFQRVGLAKGSKSPTAGRMPGLPVAAEPYNGQLYILVQRSSGLEGVICATTGTQLSTVAEIPFACTPQCMTQYAGRLYIGAVGYDLDGNDGHGELYELTGNALRLVKSWYRDRQMAASFITGIFDLDVFDGLLCFVNQGQHGVEFYDAAQDAFFTGPCIEMDSTLTTYNTSATGFNLVTLRDQILVWMDHGLATSRGIFKIRQATDGVPTHAGMGGVLQTSDFGPEPGRKKAWGDVAIRTRGAETKGMQFSIDGGAVWTSVPVFAADVAGELYTSIFQLGLYAAPGRRIRLRFILWSPVMFTQTIEVNAFTMHFSFIESGFHGFQLTMPAVHNIECPDGTIYTGDAADIRNAIWGWADTGAIINLIDRDLVIRPCVVTQPVESEPVLNDQGQREAFLNCYLLEV